MSRADVYFIYYSHCFFGPEPSFIDPNMSIILIFSLLSLSISCDLWHVGIISGLIDDHEILILCSALRVRISALPCILMHSQPRKMSFSGVACPHQSRHQETPARPRANKHCLRKRTTRVAKLFKLCLLTLLTSTFQGEQLQIPDWISMAFLARMKEMPELECICCCFFPLQIIWMLLRSNKCCSDLKIEEVNCLK